VLLGRPRLAEEALDQRLQHDVLAPLIVAFSGGGDSLALLLMAHDWARRAGRRLIAATVDHGLQPAGADWAAWCARRAAGLGLEHRTLVWRGDKPTTGLPAAARRARHGLVADLARAEGAAVILMAHTADDALEARRMRQDGARTSAAQAWSPSPVWPEGRGVFVLRPLLDWRRAALRDWLTQRGETWIEDPANDDPRFARARARAALAAEAEAELDSGGETPPFDGEVVAVVGGALVLDRADFRRAGGWGGSARGLAAALSSVGGAEQPPRREAVLRLLAKVADAGPVSATLAGARLAAGDDDRIVICREAGEFRRSGGAPRPLVPGGVLVWDGRFEVRAAGTGLWVLPLAGLAARLPSAQRRALAALPARVRPGLPAVIDQDGCVTCPILAEEGSVSVRSLAHARFLAAVGAIRDETALRCVAKAARTS
jgi:tRNA(Ile)-lysidine synthase